MSNIVQNSGFETGTLPPWTNVPNNSVIVDMVNPHTGTYAARFVGNTTSILLSQNLATTPGTTYTLSYWVAVDPVGNPGATFSVFWDGVLIPGSTISAVSLLPYTEFTFTVTATNVTTPLTFEVNIPRGTGIILLYLDDVSVVPQAICYSGESLVLAKNIITGEISEIEAKKIQSNLHEVYSVNDDKFIPVKLNIVTGPTDRYRLIKKDSLGENQPSQDFYVTAGHKIVIDGIETKARDIPQAKRVKVEPEMVYSICTDKHEPILVNNLPVVSWGLDEWLGSTKQKNIKWTNNKINTFGI
ncbi:hypothetical protein QJ856_gp0297 [Tupanvirus deep ocean]|uniref:Uncharacterized protein n=2 Tax=Tupanvirus TaxID=2094720 RepID=A0AC62A9T4_9VIRU|nr:hypothetical protein QJ856_gp0297 [Tupanvirus deep ocean]QKU34437.1 hypothetical protein [Tupanvirus deep ocean]